MVASSGALGNFRWPYHAIVMKMFDAINRRTVRMEGPRRPLAAKRQLVSMVTCSQATGEEADHGPVERGKIAGLPAAYPVLVLDHLAINPLAARVADVILDAVVAGQGPPADQAGRHQLPGSVTDDGERFASVLHGPQERLHLRHHPHGVRVQGTPAAVA